jgi:hypothetical protein
LLGRKGEVTVSPAEWVTLRIKRNHLNNCKILLINVKGKVLKKRNETYTEPLTQSRSICSFLLDFPHTEGEGKGI